MSGRDLGEFLRDNAKEITIFVMIAGVVWWAARLDDRVTQIESRGSPQLEQIAARIAVLEAGQIGIERRLDALSDRLEAVAPAKK